MMYRYLKFIAPLILLFALFAFSPENAKYTSVEREQATSIAYYQFYHIKDTTQKGRVYSEDFILAFNAEKSIYTSQTRLMQDSALQAMLKLAETKNSNVIDVGRVVPTTEDDIYSNNGKLSVVKKHRDQQYLISGTTDKADWKIGEETKQLLGYTAQIATAVVKGRKYTAWFTTDIPGGFGPWKLSGLPGLVLEAYDDHHFIKFTCNRVIMGGNFQNIPSVTLPEKSIPTSLKEYERMKQAEFQGFAMNDFGTDARIEKVTSTGGNNNSSNLKKKFTENYPLELTN